MAVTVTARSAAAVALLALNKPVLVGSNVLRPELVNSMQWRQGGQWSAGTDETDADGQTKAAGDGYTGRKTYPDALQTTWYFMMKWTTTASFDCAAIIGHNFSGLALTTCQLQVADNTAFSTNLRTIASWTPGTSTKRLVSLALDHDAGGARVYSGVEYARLKLVSGGSIRPRIGELILGTQVQLSFKPDDDYDPHGQVSGVALTESYSGVVSGVTHYRQRRELDAALTLHDSTEAAKVTTWWTDCRGGTRPFLWIDDPTSGPQSAALMAMPEPEARLPYESANVRSSRIKAVEQGPDFVALEA
jgi:hypothetical protein